jgi:hypothetical protein
VLDGDRVVADVRVDDALVARHQGEGVDQDFAGLGGRSSDQFSSSCSSDSDHRNMICSPAALREFFAVCITFLSARRPSQEVQRALILPGNEDLVEIRAMSAAARSISPCWTASSAISTASVSVALAGSASSRSKALSRLVAPRSSGPCRDAPWPWRLPRRVRPTEIARFDAHFIGDGGGFVDAFLVEQVRVSDR